VDESAEVVAPQDPVLPLVSGGSGALGWWVLVGAVCAASTTVRDAPRRGRAKAVLAPATPLPMATSCAVVNMVTAPKADAQQTVRWAPLRRRTG
jgi:hypothetical protein